MGEDAGGDPGGRNGLEEQQLLGVGGSESYCTEFNFVSTAAVTRAARGA